MSSSTRIRPCILILDMLDIIVQLFISVDENMQNKRPGEYAHRRSARSGHGIHMHIR
jgi:hypothetical protein